MLCEVLVCPILNLIPGCGMSVFFCFCFFILLMQLNVRGLNLVISVVSCFAVYFSCSASCKYNTCSGARCSLQINIPVTIISPSLLLGGKPYFRRAAFQLNSDSKCFKFMSFIWSGLRASLSLVELWDDCFEPTCGTLFISLHHLLCVDRIENERS